MKDEGDENDGGRYDELSASLAGAQADIAALKNRAEQSQDRASTGEARADADRDRIGALEGRADVDALLLAELKSDGLVVKKHAENFEAALRSSRKIGAAMGIVMAKHHASEEEAFEMLRKASMDANRKLRDLADEVVLTGEVNPPTH